MIRDGLGLASWHHRKQYVFLTGAKRRLDNSLVECAKCNRCAWRTSDKMNALSKVDDDWCGARWSRTRPALVTIGLCSDTLVS